MLMPPNGFRRNTVNLTNWCKVVKLATGNHPRVISSGRGDPVLSPAVIDFRWGQLFASLPCFLCTGELRSTLARRVGTQANPYIDLPYIDLFEAIGWHRWLVQRCSLSHFISFEKFLCLANFLTFFSSDPILILLTMRENVPPVFPPEQDRVLP